MDISPIMRNHAKLHKMKIITRKLHVITRKRMSIRFETLRIFSLKLYTYITCLRIFFSSIILFFFIYYQIRLIKGYTSQKIVKMRSINGLYFKNQKKEMFWMTWIPLSLPYSGNKKTREGGV